MVLGTRATSSLVTVTKVLLDCHRHHKQLQLHTRNKTFNYRVTLEGPPDVKITKKEKYWYPFILSDD